MFYQLNRKQNNQNYVLESKLKSWMNQKNEKQEKNKILPIE